MSAAERAQKKRVRASLFPQDEAAAREKDAKRHRDARRVEQVERDQQTLKGWPALVARLQEPCLDSTELCNRDERLKKARQAAARLGVELVPPVPDDLPHESGAARAIARADTVDIMRRLNAGQVQATLTAAEPEDAASASIVNAEVAKPRKRATHELKRIGGGWHLVRKA